MDEPMIILPGNLAEAVIDRSELIFNACLTLLCAIAVMMIFS